jgi:predicted permease
VNYAQLLFPDFLLILCGYLVCRFTALNRTVWEQVDSLVYYFLFPVLLFQSVVKTKLELHAASGLIAAGWSVGLIGIAMAYSLPYLPWLRTHIDRRDHAASAQVAFRFNSFVGLALADRLGGAQGQLAIAVLIGVCVPLFNTAAVLPMARHGQNSLWRALLNNPLVLATGGGMVANVMGLHIPAWMEPSVSRVGAASLALGLMAAGAGMQFGRLAQAKVLGLALLGIRHCLSPIVALVISRWYGLNEVQFTMLMAFAALPTASSCYVLAARMGYNGGYVGSLVTLSTMLGVASLTFSLGVLRFL